MAPTHSTYFMLNIIVVICMGALLSNVFILLFGTQFQLISACHYIVNCWEYSEEN